MTNPWFRSAAALMFLGVAFGAFGAHGLKDRLSAEALDIYNKAVFYQMIHALGLFVVSLAVSNRHTGKVRLAGYSFLLGILFFSGSLYLLALTGVKAWGAVTPIGGVLFLVGWGSLALS